MGSSGEERRGVVSRGVGPCMGGGSTVHVVFRRKGHLHTGCNTSGIFSFDLKGPDMPTPSDIHRTVVRLMGAASPAILRKCVDGTNFRSMHRAVTRSLGEHFTAGFSTGGLVVAINTTDKLGIVLGAVLGPKRRIVIFTPCFLRCNTCIHGCSNVLIRVSPSAAAFRPGLTRFRRGVAPGAETIVMGAPRGPAKIMCSRRAVGGLSTVLRTGRGRFKAIVCLVSSRPCHRLTCSNIRIPCLAGCCGGAIMNCSCDGSLSLPNRHVKCLIVPSRTSKDRRLVSTTAVTGHALNYMGTPSLVRGMITGYMSTGASLTTCSGGQRTLCGNLGRYKFRYVGPRNTFCLFMGSPIRSRGTFYRTNGGCGVLVMPKDSFTYPNCIELTCYMSCRAVIGSLPRFGGLTTRCNLGWAVVAGRLGGESPMRSIRTTLCQKSFTEKGGRVGHDQR